jgi:predicted nucleic acid-binding Zn ribbon protein
VEEWRRKALAKGRRTEHRRALAKFLSLHKVCRQCGRRIKYAQRFQAEKFCSNSCSAIFNNKRRGRKWKCKDCDKPIENGAKHCRRCWLRHRDIITSARTDATRRRILIRKHGRRCFGCRRTVWQGQPIPIELDHIDGNSDNNAEENLRLLCPNCHAQTPTYKSKNRGKAGKRGQKGQARQDA